ncbi:kinesin-like protein KIN-4C isoform X2 [Corylus avellana]|uniref:kinesin-like protein KIN-4C isoform X2 n=1 Tax=Corylus avellana TaxID=13451 RepID=UPI00286B4EB6|nr:kinesin-like protein KIN-4C isoform X2 [Corylus avellana]
MASEIEALSEELNIMKQKNIGGRKYDLCKQEDRQSPRCILEAMGTSESEDSGEKVPHCTRVAGNNCICTRVSSCKTMKCQCRAAGSSCRTSCTCVTTKCTNRGSASNNELAWDCQSPSCILEAMDTSESEDSGEDRDDADWVKSEKRRTNNSKAIKSVSCLCTRFSSCKTMKCQCRAAGSSCRTSCTCVATKCTNRGSASNDELDELPGTYIFEDNGSSSGSVEKEKSCALAFHGAMLLQSALVEKPFEANDENGPLSDDSDIGNTLAKSKAPKSNQRKK